MAENLTVICDRCGGSVTLVEEDIVFANSIGRNAYDEVSIGWLCMGCTEQDQLEDEERAEEASRRQWNEYGDAFYREHPHG